MWGIFCLIQAGDIKFIQISPLKINNPVKNENPFLVTLTTLLIRFDKILFYTAKE